MKRTKPQFTRLIELDRSIRDCKYPNALTFATDYEVSQKTVQRDIEYLRDSLGAPLEYDRERKGYYYTHNHWFLPSLSLGESDLYALLFAYRALEQYHGTPVADELRRVFRKFVENLPDKLAVNPELIFERFSFTLPPSKPVSGKIWSVIVQALLQQRSARIKYRSFNTKETTERIVDPYHIANLQGEWYIFAWCHTKRAVLQFGIPQIQEVALLERRFKIPASFSAKEIISSTFRRHALGSKTEIVRLRFDKEIADRVTQRIWHPKQKVRRLRDGGIELAFSTAGLFEVSRWVLAWGRSVKVVAPAALKKLVADEINQMVKNL